MPTALIANNLLTIPFKKTYPLNIKDAARTYIYDHGGGHPDEFKADINRWQKLRKDGVGGEPVHDSRIKSALLYHAQLLSILTKFPTDIQLDISYAPIFQPSAVPITLKNLAFERCGVLFNLAALYSQVAEKEDRQTKERIKKARGYYQYAAGVLSFLRTSGLPTLVFSPDEEIPLDLSQDFVQGLEWLMVAQAQECSWQVAVIDEYMNSLISKIAAMTASFYQSALTTIGDAVPSIKSLFPLNWIPHIETKIHHFNAAAQYRMSMDEGEASRYGLQISRLIEAQVEAKKAYDKGRRGKVAASVLQDAKSLLTSVEADLVKREKDNDNIYHHETLPSSSLVPIVQRRLVTPEIPPELVDPAKILGSDYLIFGELAGWGAKEAINIYNHRKEILVREKIVGVAQELQDEADQALRTLNLPSSLEALERPVGLPPSLLGKSEEVRLENGPTKIEVSIEDVQRLAQHDLAILDEAMDILDHEASEDEAARRDKQLSRLPSHEANVELIDKEKRYRSILSQALSSDEVVRQKWDDWEHNIVELTWSEEELEASIPSSALSTATTQGKQTQAHARALRVLIEELDDLHRARNQLIRRAQTLADADDIRARILKVSSGFERFAQVEPAMFEEVLDEELAKYDKFLREIGEVGQKQKGLLSDIQSRNELFLQCRRDDPSVKEREYALQSLDLAYHKYREIIRNLDEGFKFYNDLAGILVQFKEACKNWSHHRNQEIHSLSRSVRSMSLSDNEEVKVPAENSRIPSSHLRNEPLGKSSLGLPSLTSSEWGFEEIKLPPGPRGG